MGERSQWSGFVRFSVVGDFGVVVDMLVLFLFLWMCFRFTFL